MMHYTWLYTTLLCTAFDCTPHNNALHLPVHHTVMHWTWLHNTLHCTALNTSLQWHVLGDNACLLVQNNFYLFKSFFSSFFKYLYTSMRTFNVILGFIQEENENIKYADGVYRVLWNLPIMLHADRGWQTWLHALAAIRHRDFFGPSTWEFFFLIP